MLSINLKQMVTEAAATFVNSIKGELKSDLPSTVPGPQGEKPDVEFRINNNGELEVQIEYIQPVVDETPAIVQSNADKLSGLEVEEI